MKVFITRPIPAQSLTQLQELGVDIDVYEYDAIISPAALLKRVRGVDAILSQTDDNISADVMDAAGKQLKIIANYGVGFSNVDVNAANARNIVVSNTPVEDAFEATAEATVCLLTSVAKKINYLHSYRQRHGKDPDYSPVGPMGLALRGKTCGIVGMGNIGSRVARIMHYGFNNRILYFDRPKRKHEETTLSAVKCSLPELLSQSDFICINLPLLDSTRNLINKEMIGLLKNNAIIVNASRPGIVDDEALVIKINNAELHGAGLDVYTDAVGAINPNANVVLTAHMANLELEAFAAMAQCAVSNIVNVLSGRPPVTPIST